MAKAKRTDNVEVTAAAEAERWAEAAGDPEFAAEVAEIARRYADAETWPR